MKKFLSIIMAVFVVFTLTMSVAAAGPNEQFTLGETVEVDGHEYSITEINPDGTFIAEKNGPVTRSTYCQHRRIAAYGNPRFETKRIANANKN